MSEDFLTFKDDQLDRRLYIIFAVNLLVAGLTLLGWPLLQPIVAGPLQWGTGNYVGSHPELLAYPVVSLWSAPVLAMAIAWILRSEGQRQWAITLASAPLIFLAILTVCYHLGLSKLG